MWQVSKNYLLWLDLLEYLLLLICSSSIMNGEFPKRSNIVDVLSQENYFSFFMQVKYYALFLVGICETFMAKAAFEVRQS